MRSARRLRLLWIVCLCLCLAPRFAVADAAQARAHFDRGRTFFEVDQYRKAIAEFKAGHLEKADPAFLYNIAECHRRLGELVFYRRFLDAAPPGDKTRPIVEQRIDELKSVADENKPAGEPAAGDALALNAPATGGQPAAGVLVDQPGTARPSGGPPFYTRPWFLITVGAVVVASVVSIWALSRAPEPPGTALGNQSVF
jgi:hypothetical protein